MLQNNMTINILLYGSMKKMVIVKRKKNGFLGPRGKID